MKTSRHKLSDQLFLIKTMLCANTILLAAIILHLNSERFAPATSESVTYRGASASLSNKDALKELQEEIANANAIVLADRVSQDRKVRDVITEILMKNPDVPFYYGIGEQIGSATTIKPDTRYGDGSVIFCQGSPARLKRAAAIYDGRIPAFGQLPVTKLREMVAEHASLTAPEQESEEPAQSSKNDHSPSPESRRAPLPG
ncbi:MAG: hypothetical protein Q7Q71_15935 [Verrucomicrobiota bacterium JB023]|nr:hypothetical protein [Verrucomicrobiota bacterium JB023]